MTMRLHAKLRRVYTPAPGIFNEIDVESIFRDNYTSQVDPRLRLCDFDDILGLFQKFL